MLKDITIEIEFNETPHEIIITGYFKEVDKSFDHAFGTEKVIGYELESIDWDCNHMPKNTRVFDLVVDQYLADNEADIEEKLLNELA